MSASAALRTTLFFVSMGGLFAAFLAWRFGSAPAREFVTGYVIEYAGGTVSARADWQGADGSVSVAVDGIAPSQAQAHLLVANLQGMRVMGQPDPSGLVISRAAAGDSRIHLTFANPSTTTAVVMTVTLR